MALQLSIIKFPPGVALVEDRKTFGPLGGVIGRGVDNDWVLSDPERFLSSKHCQITQEGERYFLTDLSTNGTFVNGSTEPLGRGSRTQLKDGDSFDVGEYRFKVVLERENDVFASSPFGATGGLKNPSPFGMDDVGGGYSVKSEAVFMSSDYQGVIEDIAPDSMKIVDPLLALDNANRPLREKSPFTDPFANSGSREDSANLMSEAIAWPDSKQEGALLPEDWADDISLIGARHNASIPYSLPDDDALIQDKSPLHQPNNSLLQQDPFSTAGAKSSVRQTKTATDVKVTTGVSGSKNPRPVEQPAAKETPVRPRPASHSQPAHQSQPAKAVPQAPKPVRQMTAPSGNLDRTLVDAMGLSDVDLTEEQLHEIHATVGAMVRETLDGLMQVLRSRTSIKNEFRINITTIQPIENNPLKFSASVDEVLDLMFIRKTRAYKPALDAIEESFHSIADHQLAVIAGIRSAFRSALTKFDPERLEEEFKQSGKSGLMPGVLKGRMWNAYQEHYQKVVNDMERSFQELFGDEFVQAYEDQMRKLSQARKRDL